MPTTPSSSTAIDRSSTAITVDNLLRQALKVSDPNDSSQIADGLRKRFVADAGLEERERQGLPAVRAPLDMAAPASAGPISLETDQGLDDLEQDLRAILQESQLKDVRAELQGWARAIRSAASDGLAAARLARDPIQRDRAFSARRSLADYARLSRYVGALSGGLNALYRKLAQSCDVVASLVLVGCGEALASIGTARSSFILQAPVSELQVRRDAALAALRNLIGSTQYAYGPNDWPRGLEAYRRLLTRLDQSGQSDLRALFNEANLGRLFDELIDMAAGNTAAGLRALGATAMISLERVNRLIAFGQRGPFQFAAATGAVTPESPPLATFLSALRLFVEAFEDANRGYRLVYIARPPILTYGLYGQSGIDPETDRLIQLIIWRNRFAEQIDCLMRCDCSDCAVRWQLRLDKVLFDVDQAINYRALGTGVLDESGEVRSLAYGAVIASAFQFARAEANPVAPAPPHPCHVPNGLRSSLQQLGTLLGWTFLFGGAVFDWSGVVPAPGAANFAWDADTPDLAEELGLIPGNVAANVLAEAIAANDVVLNPADPDWTWDEIVHAAALAARAQAAAAQQDQVELVTAETIRRRQLHGELLHQELCQQRAGEVQWERLVRAIAPSCIAPRMIPERRESLIMAMLDGAHILVRAATFANHDQCPPIEVGIPPNFETSLDTIANDVLRDGRNRPP